MHKEWFIIIGTGIACLHLAACSQTANMGEHFTLTGTPDGIRAFSDMQVGTIKTAKETDDANNQYFAHRATYEGNVTARQMTKPQGFIQKLFTTDTQEGK